MTNTLVLCVGMHRSGTSLTAGLLETLGCTLPGTKVAADNSNPTGYFENKDIVDKQEQLLTDLGFWWPTEQASYGLPRDITHQLAYHSFIEWLTNYLQNTVAHHGNHLAIKDPRTSLLLPAWREAASRLEIQIKLLICVREPRDVCRSLVVRDGPQVGMDWSRAQRLWLEHYLAILNGSEGLSFLVTQYESWLDRTQAKEQLIKVANFIDLECSTEKIATALERIRPEFNHGGGNEFPRIDRAVRRVHHALRSNHQRKDLIQTANSSKKRLLRHQWRQLRLERLRALASRAGKKQKCQ